MIPDSALLTNGVKNGTGITGFNFNLGNVEYPIGNRFRDSNYNPAPEIGVQVLNGNVVALLLGGVLSGEDYPYSTSGR